MSGKAEIVYINALAAEWHANDDNRPLRPIVPLGHSLRSVPPVSEIQDEDGTIMPSPDRWAKIERAACDPDLVNSIELGAHVLDEATIPENRLAALQDVGFYGVCQDVRVENGLSDAEFELTLAMCYEAVREEHGLDEQTPGNNYC